MDTNTETTIRNLEAAIKRAEGTRSRQAAAIAATDGSIYALKKQLENLQLESKTPKR